MQLAIKKVGNSQKYNLRNRLSINRLTLEEFAYKMTEIIFQLF